MEGHDLYFTPEYGKLYESIENAEFRSFSFQNENGEIYYQYLKRPVPMLLNGIQYYDAMTPYGYGGPLVVRCEPGKEQELCSAFQAALDSHLQEEGIVSEFVRFHPMEGNAEFFRNMYMLRNRRTAVYTDLSGENPVAEEFDRHTQKIIRRMLRKGVTTEIIQDPSEEDYRAFQSCYYENMRLVGAKEYYYFDKTYFQGLWDAFHDKLILVMAYFEGALVGADLGFADPGVYTCHLMGVTDLGHKLNISRVIIGAQVCWAKEHGFDYLFHGCGLTGAEDDNLLNFKKFFTKSCFRDYWQGGRISNSEVYTALCAMSGKQDDGNGSYFPAYRMQ